MICASCQHANPDDAAFCGGCGASLRAATACPACGRDNPSGQTFCNGCGQRLEATPAGTSPERAPLLLLEPPPPSLRLLARRQLVVADELAPALDRFRATDGLTYVAFRPFRERDVARAATGPLEIVLRTSSLVLARVHPP